ncbi:MAG: ABC transporter permease [Opitutales bacterium]
MSTAAQVDTGALSQWQLIRLRFCKHRLAMISLAVLVFSYAVALFAEFVALYPSNETAVEQSYCPPQSVRLSLSEGLYTHPMDLQIDPITLQKYYIEDREKVVPLGFFVKGSPYKLWGLIPMERHLFGPDVDEFDPETSPRFYLFGADKFGRDIASRLVYGARISLSVGLLAIALTFVLGIVIGGISGYVGGAVDNFIQRSIEVLNSFPTLPLWLAAAAIMPGDWPALKVYFAITIVLSLLGWTGLARVVRGKILSLREEDYAVAARLIGANHGRIIFLHLLPGFFSHIIVSLSLSVPGMILGETALSFLGLGLRPPIVSWGVMLQDCMNMDVVANYPWLLLPVIFIITTVLAFNFLGDGLRDAADPYSAK